MGATSTIWPAALGVPPGGNRRPEQQRQSSGTATRVAGLPCGPAELHNGPAGGGADRAILAKFAEWFDVPVSESWPRAARRSSCYGIPRALASRRSMIVGPTYADYADACRLHGIRPVFSLCTEKHGFRPDPARLEQDLRQAEADLVFICNPNNPTGVLLPAEAIRELCRRNPRVRFVVDESYLPFVRGASAKAWSTTAWKMFSCWCRFPRSSAYPVCASVSS